MVHEQGQMRSGSASQLTHCPIVLGGKPLGARAYRMADIRLRALIREHFKATAFPGVRQHACRQLRGADRHPKGFVPSNAVRIRRFKSWGRQAHVHIHSLYSPTQAPLRLESAGMQEYTPFSLLASVRTARSGCCCRALLPRKLQPYNSVLSMKEPPSLIKRYGPVLPPSPSFLRPGNCPGKFGCRPGIPRPRPGATELDSSSAYMHSPLIGLGLPS